MPTHPDFPHPLPVWCRTRCPWPPRMVGWSRGQFQPVGDTAVLSYIIIRAAKSSSRRRNCQKKGCQSNFNSTSWQICLLMGSLITSSQPTFSSTRLLLYSGHDGQTAINEGPVNILFCPFFIPCVAPGIICHMPALRIIHLLLGSSLMCISAATVRFPHRKEFLFQHFCEQST